MKEISKKLTELIGKAPLLELSNFNIQKNALCRIVAKPEYFNPGGVLKTGLVLLLSA